MQALGSQAGGLDSIACKVLEDEGGCAPPARPWEASTHLRSEVKEQGDAARDLAQPQPQQGHERGAGGGGGGMVRGGLRGRRRRGVQGALVRGAGAAAAHLLGGAQVLGVVSAGAAHGARPASLRRSPPSGAVLPAAKCKGSAEPARGQAGLDVGALRAGRCSWGARASEEGAGRPNSYKPLREGWPREPISPGRACLFHSHPWLPFLPFALPPLLSP